MNDPQTEDGDRQSVPPCPTISPKLIGWTNLSAETMSSILEEEENVVDLRMKEAGLEAGGKYEPKECRSHQRVAIIVPVRDRKEHLTVFLRYMHPFLQRKQMSYVIIVVEQSEHLPFNRGMLMNIGFKEVQLFEEKYQCLILHDVDMLPEHDGNPYACPEEGRPRQMAFSMNYFKNYTPVGEGFFGAVTAISTADFQRINGFSNSFWGWGGEDENLYHRVIAQKLTVVRPFDGQPLHSVRYMMQSHKRAVPSPGRFDVMKGGRSGFQADGLVNLNYQKLDYQLKPLCTHVLVNLQPSNTSAT